MSVTQADKDAADRLLKAWRAHYPEAWRTTQALWGRPSTEEEEESMNGSDDIPLFAGIGAILMAGALAGVFEKEGATFRNYRLRKLLNAAPEEHHWSIVCAFEMADRTRARQLEHRTRERDEWRKQFLTHEEELRELEYLRPAHETISKLRRVRDELLGIAELVPVGFKLQRWYRSAFGPKWGGSQ